MIFNYIYRKMFIRSFIELLMFYKNMQCNLANKLASTSLLNKDIFNYKVERVNDDISLCLIFNDFIVYYDEWYMSYYK